MQPQKPKLKLISSTFIQNTLAEAVEILETLGVFVENREAYQILLTAGAQPLHPTQEKVGRLSLPHTLVESALETARQSLSLWDIPEATELSLTGDHVHFDPGSAALFIHDLSAGRIRKPITQDLLRYVCLVDKLPHYHLQSTALISSDVPEACADSYRLYLALKHGRKPVVTGTFNKASFGVMQEMLTSVRGGAKNLRDRPLAIFDACPSPPLMWSDLTAQSVIEAARAGIPSEFVSMPLTGSTAPVTLSGAIVQHAAETLSGVVLAQAACRGAPVIWGGSPAAMDLRFGTTPMGAIETMMIDLAYAEIGKWLGLPTHAYMGLSDTKQVDYQAGLESGIGIILAGLGGINVVSGAGMMDFESCQSLEKLVLDHEACAMAYRLREGIVPRDKTRTIDLLSALLESGHLLTHPHTLKWFKEEMHSPGKAIDRRARSAEALDQLPTAVERAHLEVEKLLKVTPEPILEGKLRQELDRLMERELRRAGGGGLPEDQSLGGFK